MVTLFLGVGGLFAVAVALVWRKPWMRYAATAGLVLVAAAVVMGALGQRHWAGCQTKEFVAPQGVSLPELNALGVDTTSRPTCPASSPLGLRDPF